jgi:hypothetical protein
MPRIDVDQAGLGEIKPVQIVKQQDLSNNDKKLGEEEILMAHMHQFRMFRRDIKLYSRSYLGYGLMIARQLIFLNENNDLKLIESHQLRSRCFLHDVTEKFKFPKITWTVQSHKGYISLLEFSKIKLIDI